jgi:manganese/iron transport system ATP-binding protein
MSLIKEIKKTTQHLRKQRQPHIENSSILQVSNLNLRYENGTALEDITFDVHRGERVAIIGPNGAGKSTLLKIIAGVLSATGGNTSVYGHEPGGHICIAYLPQRSQVDWNFPVTVADAVLMGRIGQLGLFRNPGPRDQEIVQEALDIVGMTALANRQISQLSGGQQQRMFIARALTQQAELVLMDEPLTGLDLNSQEELFDILDELKNHDVTVLVALHDLKMAARYFDRVMLLKSRILGFGDPKTVFSAENLVQAYGGHLHLVDTGDGVLAVGDTCCDEIEDAV